MTVPSLDPNFTNQKHVMYRARHAHCGLIAVFEEGVSVKTHGDKDNPELQGYSCIKGDSLRVIMSSIRVC